jgi:cation:H+ antiporter
MTVILLVMGLVLLYVGAELLVRSAAALAFRLGISSLVIGLTIVAYGTSAPEMTVSTMAAFAGQGDIAVTNVVGSNIFNIAFILGITSLICPIRISRQFVRWDVPIMIFVSLLCCLMLLDKFLTRLDGSILLQGIIFYTIWIYRIGLKSATGTINSLEYPAADKKAAGRLPILIVCIFAGLILLVLGSKALVAGATSIARSVGLSEAVIGLTIISAGTSLPELATSVVAAFRRQPDIAVGNVIGSNIFNILAILGTSSLLVPYSANGLTNIDLSVMVGFAVITLPLMWTKFSLSRTEGLFLLAGYGIYLWHLWPQTNQHF